MEKNLAKANHIKSLLPPAKAGGNSEAIQKARAIQKACNLKCPINCHSELPQ